MHSLAHCRSDDHRPSSRTSRNVAGASGKSSGGKGNASGRDNAVSVPPLVDRPRSPPPDLSRHLDASDTDDCGSVGSNHTPPPEPGDKINSRRRSSKTGKSTPVIDNKNSSRKKQPREINHWTSNVGKKSTEKSGQGGAGPGSGADPAKRNSSSDLIPRETNHWIPITPRNNYKISADNSGGGETYGVHAQRASNKISRSLKTYSSRGSSLRNSPKLQINKTSSILINPDDKSCTHHLKFDEGDGGGPPDTKSLPDSNKNEKKHHRHHRRQHQNDLAEESSVDDGDGGGRGRQTRSGYAGNYAHADGGGYGNGYAGTYADRFRHRSSGIESGRSRGSGASSRRSSKGSRGSNGESRDGSQGKCRRSRDGSRGSSIISQRSRHGSRGSGSRRSRSGSSANSRESYAASNRSGLSALSLDKPYPAKWRCFGRRPPAIHEFRPLGEGRVPNVRPAGKRTYLARVSDEKHGLGRRRDGDASDLWDVCYGLAKPITDQWSTPLPYGTHLVRAGDIDPYFHPSRGDIVIINPAQNFYRAMKTGYVLTYRGGREYSFGVGDLIVRLGRFMPSGNYIPYGNLELYMHTQTREKRLLGRQPFLLVDFNYHNLDYESPGKHLAIGTFLNEMFFPRRGDVIIRGGAWAENYPNNHRVHHSFVKYWRPNMQFLPNDMLLRPYVDIGRPKRETDFYWGAAELYTYSGKGLAWAYWGRDHHICDTPYPREQEHGIKCGYHKDEIGHFASKSK